MVRPDGGIGRRNGLKIRCPKRTCGFDPRSGYHFFEYFGISCALLSSSTRSSTVVYSLATSSAKHNLCSNYFKKTCGFYFLPPQSGCGIGCLALLALPGLRYSGSAPLSRLVDPRSGYHDIQRFITFYLTENPLQHPNGMILLASSRYFMITRILGYFWDIKSKSVAVGKFRQNDHKTIFPQKIFGSKKERYKTNPVCGKPPLAGSFKKVPIQKLIIKIFTDLPVLGTEPFSIILPYLFAISLFR